ncbi:DUF2306 domain-containing protein [Sphingosinicella sp. CPCC 101087]|uniref:DUF2306 domain-containing protein n=1 Tax=Sphingosinicella sp. CPCC 101087 TaxID=2497754 RepID=UPI00101CDF51|nr:DUF2306 domain-containing protein [Sphingosinicella sp. CPCC 101087]
MRAAELVPAAGSATQGGSAVWLRWSGTALAASAWFSAALFGIYIIFFYAGAIAVGTPADWNEVLPGLFAPETPAATAGIAAHFAAGAILLLLGPVQLVGRIRRAAPALHHWIGRLYVASALIAGLGGLAFILVRGTVGGTVMDLGFGLYGALVVAAAVETLRHARARRLERHRAWAIRLFALAIGSWLYRLEYGLWFVATGAAGHTADFRGGFDLVMDFAFYLPNLLVAELFIRARAAPGRPLLQTVSALLLTAATAVIALATWEFARLAWLPGIAFRVTG